MSVLDDAVSQSFQHTPAILPQVQPAAAAPAPTQIAAPSQPAPQAAAPSVLDQAVSQSFAHTPSAGYQPDEEKAGVAGGLMEPQANAAVGIANLIGRGAEIMMGKPKGSLTGTVSHEQPLSTSGEIGKVAGDASQWFAGEGALDHLAGIASTATELANASKFIKTPVAWAEYLKESPKAAWLLKAISGVAKGSAVGAGVGAVQGSATGNTLQGAGSGAKAGAVAGAVAPVLEKVVNPWAAARAAKTALSASDVQPTLQQGIREMWNNVAAKEGVPPVGHATSIRDAGKQIGDYILDRSKTLYKQIDEATGNRFQPLSDKIEAVNQKLRGVTNDQEEQELLVNKQRYEMQLDQVFDDAVGKNGITRDSVTTAKKDFKTAQAIYDTNMQIQASTKGVRPGMTGSATEPEVVDPKGMMTRMNKLYDKGRLQQAVGEDGADDLIGHAAHATTRTRQVLRNRIIAGSAVAASPFVRHVVEAAAPAVTP